MCLAPSLLNCSYSISFVLVLELELCSVVCLLDQGCGSDLIGGGEEGSPFSAGLANSVIPNSDVPVGLSRLNNSNNKQKKLMHKDKIYYCHF